jgi:hypothetical protein
MKHFVWPLCLFALLLLTANNLVAQNWVIGGNNVATNVTLGTNTNYAIVFETNNVERGRINNGGNWGIGAGAPGAKLHVNSVATKHPFQASIDNAVKFIIHSNGNTGIGTTTPQQKLHVNGNEILSTGAQAGFKFRNRSSTSTADDWVWYSASNIARFYKVGTGDILTIAPSGNVVVGAAPPTDKYKFQVLHGSFGIDLKHGTYDWELYTNIGGGLSLYANGAFKGSFSNVNGAYTASSDEKLKTNIKEMPSILDKVNQLKPSTYKFKDALQRNDTTVSYGFIAQDLLKIFPNVVTHLVDNERGVDTYSVDYSAFGVIAIKAIQELQKDNDKQLQKIQSLENRLAKLESVLVNMNVGGSGIDKSLQGLYLDQNYPNPFNDVTTFKYQIPSGADAAITIYDLSNGELVKTMQVNDSGKFQFSASELKAGMYNYTLTVNGQVVGSRKMIVNK